jgi:formylmethanofuran dehydrogenase subunit B
MFADGVPKRDIIYLGGKPQDTSGAAARVVPCSNLGEAFGALRAILAGKQLQAEQAGGIAMTELAQLAQRMREASYGVLVWVAADLDQPHAELAIQSMSTLVTDLNVHTRFAALPISGSDGDMTANQVALWQTGFTMRTSFGPGVPEYDPYHYACNRMLENGEADALLWISAYDTGRVPPSSQVPTIVLGRAGMRFDRPPAVYIPVATPGIHHAGHFFRGDNVVALRLRKLIDVPLPAVADVLGQIEAALRG